MRKLDTKTIVVASHNAGKIREIAELIGPLQLVAPPVLADWAATDPDDGWW